jgi:hypothetical protein
MFRLAWDCARTKGHLPRLVAVPLSVRAGSHSPDVIWYVAC